MKTLYGPAVREQVRQRMSPPKRESVAEIARSTGIAVPLSTVGAIAGSRKACWCRPAARLRSNGTLPADKLAAVIQAAALRGYRLGIFL